MSLPSQDDLFSLDYATGGSPFVCVALSTVDGSSMDTAAEGSPFFSIGPAVGGPTPAGGSGFVTVAIVCA